MKKLLFSLAFIIYAQLVWAQKDSLQLDEGNKYVYYKVVDKPDLPADTLFKRGWNFAAAFNTYGKPVKGEAENALNTSGKFIVYTGVSVMRKEGGEVTYILNLQAKDQKYRYKFGSFVFTPYKRDRFGNMVPVAGMRIPLENMPARYSQKEADAYLNQVAEFCLNASVKLKQAMDRAPGVKKPDAVKRVSTDKW